jgi:hypothetical protein
VKSEAQNIPAGLCERCVHVHVVENRRGSRFYRCMLADTDPRFAKYPPLPVLACAGFVPADAEAAPGGSAQ